MSFYAATKRSNELMADTYAYLYGIPSTGLRFFTVYGPYGRPDMAYYSFTEGYFAGRSIRVFRDLEEGTEPSRDFTYVDDVVESVTRLIDQAPEGARPHTVYNIGGSRPEPLSHFIATLEESLTEAVGSEVVFDKVVEALPPGDVPATYADATKLHGATGFTPVVPLEVGLREFAKWYVAFKGIDTRS